MFAYPSWGKRYAATLPCLPSRIYDILYMTGHTHGYNCRGGWLTKRKKKLPQWRLVYHHSLIMVDRWCHKFKKKTFVLVSCNLNHEKIICIDQKWTNVIQCLLVNINVGCLNLEDTWSEFGDYCRCTKSDCYTYTCYTYHKVKGGSDWRDGGDSCCKVSLEV